jgi:uncharacterized RDD family membrane protein YckC
MNPPQRASGAAIPASLERRVGAFMVDVGIALAIPLMLVSMLSGAEFGLSALIGTTTLQSLVPVLLLASCGGWALAHTAMQGGSGSIGQRVMGLRLADADADADADAGAGIGFGRALARNVVFHLAASIIVGCFSPLFDRGPRRQGWHDLAARACVIDVRGGATVLTPPTGDSAVAAAFSSEYGAPVNSAPALAVLIWDDGSPMAVYERTVCGRNPAREEGAVARALRDETLSLSKTHFEIGADPAGPWIIDRFSRNGTHLVRDGERIGLAAGLPTPLRAGDRLEFGDRSAVVGVPA